MKRFITSVLLISLTPTEALWPSSALRGLTEMFQRQQPEEPATGLQVSDEEFEFCHRLTSAIGCHLAEGGGRCAYCPGTNGDDTCLPVMVYGMACPKSRQKLQLSLWGALLVSCLRKARVRKMHECGESMLRHRSLRSLCPSTNNRFIKELIEFWGYCSELKKLTIPTQ